jgi:hypothetical protein
MVGGFIVNDEQTKLEPVPPIYNNLSTREYPLVFTFETDPEKTGGSMRQKIPEVRPLRPEFPRKNVTNEVTF